MKNDWKKVKLGNLLAEKHDYLDIEKNKLYRELTLKLYGKGFKIRRETTGSIFSTEMHNLKEGDFVTSIHQFRNGAVGIIPKELEGSVLSKNFLVFSVNKKLVNSQYLVLYLSSQNTITYLQKYSSGSATPIYPKKKILQFEIPLPPLPKQKRIVKKIKEIEEKTCKLIKANNARKKESESLIASVLKKLFTENENWETAELEKIAPLVTDNFIPSSKPKEQFKYLALESIESYTSKLLEVPIVEGQKIKSSTNKFNDRHVLYAKLRPYLNKVIAPNFSGISSTELIVLKPNQEKIIREFLVYFLRSPRFVDEATKISAGTKMPRVNTKWLKKQEVRFPKTTAEQLNIVSDLKKLESKIDNLKKDINKVDDYISALMPSVLAKAFNGEL